MPQQCLCCAQCHQENINTAVTHFLIKLLTDLSDISYSLINIKELTSYITPESSERLDPHCQSCGI